MYPLHIFTKFSAFVGSIMITDEMRGIVQLILELWEFYLTGCIAPKFSTPCCSETVRC